MDIERERCSEELLKYLREPRLKMSTVGASGVFHKSDALQWWRLVGQTKFPNLARLVRRVCATPASSVWSERLFSEAGLIYEEHRNRLGGLKCSKMLFMHHNLMHKRGYKL